MLIFLFIFLFSFTFANVGYYSTGGPFIDVLSYLGSCSPGSLTCNDGENGRCLCVDGKMYNTASSINDYIDDNYNSDCLLNNAQKKYTLTISYGDKYTFTSDTRLIYWYDSLDDMEFCKNKEGYYYNSNDNVWYSSDGQGDPICPDGYTFDYNQEKCIFDCSVIEEKAVAQCGGSQFVKSYSCSQDGTYSITCYTCDEVMSIVIQLCEQNNYSVKDGLTCNSNDGVISTNFTFPPSVDEVCIVTDGDVNLTVDSNLTDDSNLTNNTTTNINGTMNTDNIISSLTDLKNTLSTSSNEIVTNLSSLSDKLDESTNKITDKLDESTNKITDKLDESTNKITDKLDESTNKITSALSDINNTLSPLFRFSDLLGSPNKVLDGVQSSIDEGIGKYSDKQFVTQDSSTSDICLDDITFDLYGYTITIKLSDLVNSIYVSLVKGLLWLSASLLIFFNCFRTD